VKAVRGFSDFGFSYVYVIFQDGTDIYWAAPACWNTCPRSSRGCRRACRPNWGRMPRGWVDLPVCAGRPIRHAVARPAPLVPGLDAALRLQSVPGVAEVASIGGFQKQYQVTVDPNRLTSYGVPLNMVIEAIRMSNNEVGGRLIEFAGAEYMVRGRGYIKNPSDLENVVVKTGAGGAPVLLKDVGHVALGPRSGAGSPTSTAGRPRRRIVVMRHGENALNVIDRVKAKMKELEVSLPKGVGFVPTYDRSDLIHRAIATLKHELVIEMIIVCW